ncbi:Serine/threonine-protein kinase RIO3 [Varanus komodoensis]|nr:Serine/threonine-protein kinase RIO3 [Varanus komodoensis]
MDPVQIAAVSSPAEANPGPTWPQSKCPWGAPKNPTISCSLADVMSEQLAKELQLEEEDSAFPEVTSVVEGPFISGENIDTSSDLMLAQMLQMEFDREYDAQLRREEKKFNGDSKVSISFENYRKVHPFEDSDSSEDEVDWQDTRHDPYRADKPTTTPKKGFIGKGKDITTKHDEVVCGRKNTARMENFAPEFQVGDGIGMDLKLSNHVFNALKQHAYSEERRSARLHEKKEHSTAEKAVDPKTRLILYKMVSSGMLETITGCISTGKESVVFHAYGGSLTEDSKPVPSECAIKVFKTTLNEFKNRDKYIKDEYRFKDRFSKMNPRKIIRLWAEKEMHNLTRWLEMIRETPMPPSGPELLDEFQLLRPDDVDKVLGRVRPTTCLLDPCPSWLIKDSKHGIGTWILEVVNASLKESRVPAPLKEAVVRPVLKKASLDPEMATTYRPVANIPFLGKVLERVVAGQLQALLDETDYLDPFQSGFRPGYGTESALVALYDDLCREKDRGSASLLVLLDLSAAFDTIDHGILLDRLAGLGVGGTALQWFCSYLNGRFQKVVLGDYGSAPWQLCHGVPQGSILSPLLFNIYMKPLGEVVRRCGLRNHQYADYTQLYLSFSTNPGEAVAVLNWCLAEVMGWMRANKLKLNPDKTEVLLVGGSGFREGELNLVLNRVALPPRDKVRSLGVLLDPELSLEAQVTAAARSAFLQLRLIHQLRPYLECDCLATVTHALVTSRLDFCNALYVGLPLKMVRTLQLVQNRAARLLMGTGRYVHMTPVLRQLHWLPIEVRAQFKVLVMTYKALNGLGPGYLKEHLRPYMPSCPLRSAGEALLREPSVKEIRRVVTRRRAFSAVAPKMQKAGIPCPQVVTLKKHVLVMSFVGQDQVPAPKLKEVKLSSEDMKKAYYQVLHMMQQLYKECGLIHADLSEYNMLWHRGQVWLIDVSQSVEPTYLHGLEFLFRDCRNVSQFFQKNGVSEALNERELFNAVSGLNVAADNEVDFLAEIELLEKMNEDHIQKHGKKVSFFSDDDRGPQTFCYK